MCNGFVLRSSKQPNLVSLYSTAFGSTDHLDGVWISAELFLRDGVIHIVNKTAGVRAKDISED